jgi:hypothetical protein
MNTAEEKRTPIEPDTLTIERSGAWMVKRPHATGYDFGPGRITRKGETIPDADVQVQIDWYTRAGFRIVDKRKAAKAVS